MCNYKPYSIEKIKEAKRAFYKSSKCIQEILTKLKGLSLKRESSLLVVTSYSLLVVRSYSILVVRSYPFKLMIQTVFMLKLEEKHPRENQ